MTKRLPHSILHEMSRHLPPSAVELTALDLDGQAAVQLLEFRPEMRIIVLSHTSPPTPLQPLERGVKIATVRGVRTSLPLADSSIDAITGCGIARQRQAAFLREVRRVLRPGGRLILFDPRPGVLGRIFQRRYILEQLAAILDEGGFARVLVERVGEGLIARGEKPYPKSSTVERIALTAALGSGSGDLQVLDSADLCTMGRGHFVFLLIRQTPDKPPWAIAPGEPIRWDAAMITDHDERHYLLAFTSLPKAVEFMQAAVLAGLLKGVNKVGKFERTVASRWAADVVLNPPFEALRSSAGYAFKDVTLPVDPTSAVTGEE